MDARTGAGKANLSTADYKCNCNCQGCTDKVERAVTAVKACDGVKKCTVDRESNTLRVEFGNVDPDKIKQILEEKTKKTFQLLLVQSRAPAVRRNHKEDKTGQKNEKKTEGKTKQKNENKTEGKTTEGKTKQKNEKKTEGKTKEKNQKEKNEKKTEKKTEGKTKEQNEKKTEGKTKENTVQVPKKPRVEELDMEITWRLKIKGDSVATKFVPFAITAKK